MKRLVLFAVLVLLIVGVVFAYNYITAPREEVLYSYTFKESYDQLYEDPKTGERRAGDYVYANNGKSWMYDGLVRMNGKKSDPPDFYAIINGKLYPLDKPVVPSFNGVDHTVFAPRTRGKSLVILDGKVIASVSPEVTKVRTDPGNNVVVTLSSGENFTVVDGKLVRRSNAEEESLPNSAGLRTLKQNGKVLLLKDDKVIDSGVYINLIDVPGGRRTAYWKSADGKNWILKVDGKEIANSKCKSTYVAKDLPVGYTEFSKDGQRFCYVIITKKKTYLYDDKRLIDAAPSISGVSFSPDGERIGYTVRSENDIIVRVWLESARIDGRELFPGSPSYFVGFSPDSSKIAAVKIVKSGKGYPLNDGYRHAKMQVIVNGESVGPVNEGVHLNGFPKDFFSADSNHLVYMLSDSERMVIDGRIVQPKHDRIRSFVSMHKDSVTYWTQDYPKRYIPPQLLKGTRLQYVRVRFRD